MRRLSGRGWARAGVRTREHSDMKTVGIVTIVKVNNYGAELQAFALQRKLCLMGYRAEVIDYLFLK